MLNVDSFRKQLATESLDEYLSYILNVYVDSQGSDTKDGKDLISLFNVDTSSAGMTNYDDYKKFVDGTIYKNFLIDRKYAKEFLSKTTDEERLAFISKVQDEIHSLVSVPGFVVFDTSVLKGDEPIEIEHQFDLNVDAENIYAVMASIYNTARANDVNVFLSTRKVVGNVKEGYNDTITIGASTPELDSVLRVLASLPEEIKAMIKRPCQFGTIIDGILGYTAFDQERTISARGMVGKSIIETIDTIIKEVAEKHEDFKVYADSLANGEDKDQVRATALNIIREIEPEVYGSLINRIKDNISLEGINPNYLFMTDTVSINLHNTYGSIIDTEEVNIEETPAFENAAEEVLVAEEPIQEVVVEEAPVVLETVETIEPSEIPEVNVEELFTSIAPEETVDVKDVLEGKVELEPSEGIVTAVQDIELTDQEIEAVAEAAVVEDMVEAIEKPITEDNRTVYLGMGITEEYLNTAVVDKAGNSITLYEYLESNDTLNKIAPDSVVTLGYDLPNHEAGKEMTGAAFINDVIVQYAIKLGEVSVDDLIEKYDVKVGKVEPKKQSFLGKIFGKK